MASANLFDFHNIFSLEGKVVVVTGSSKGLGLSAASGMLQAGASKVYISSRTPSACEDACATLNRLPNKKPGAKAIPVPADSSTIQGIQQLFDLVSKTTDHVDILLANAGAAHPASIEKTGEKEFSDSLDLNLKSVFFCVQRFLPLLTVRGTVQDPSRIIVTSSISAFSQIAVGDVALYAYAAAKAGVNQLVKQLAVDLGPRHIVSNCIAPGLFLTDATAPHIGVYGGEETIAKVYPSGRIGKGEDFAATAVFLASRGGAHVNGHCLTLDGGFSIPRMPALV
ncbi:gluconate 5-dehydrogenase [Neofusicoccum parvum]|uniref:Gluconate 5-dehydrogenase n=1 Tax=Neofusicoccum parvum TaxID=310453 RepID=A0ACB5SDS9_9PEZI|nr:gluconate 5-dehydrogenase [Neofusicoccum parvum]